MSFILLGVLNSQVEAAGGGAYDLLETTVLGSSATSVTFSSLGSYSAYKHLQLRIVARRTSSTSGLGSVTIQYNSDTAANYVFHYLRGNGSAVDSGAQPDNTSANVIEFVPGALAATDSFGVGIIDILDFNNTSKFKTFRSLSGGYGGTQRIVLGSGLWRSSNAITSLNIAGAEFVAGSRFSLYGIK